MEIDLASYKLPSDNYVSTETAKKQIVFGHTFNHDMKHVIGWSHRYHGKYKKTAAYTISTDGTIYQHFDPKYHSRYFNKPELDSKCIVILLENDGWLIRDVEKNEFYTWIGHIYSQPDRVIEKRWREYTYWAPYTQEQLESALSLVTKLCGDFNIPVMAINHNTKIDNLLGYEGVIYRSNLEKHYTDLSPSWDCETFKNKLELI
jgi:hypothetical protein